jgi:hypothetical protein
LKIANGQGGAIPLVIKKFKLAKEM